jgi:hypothetical protein
MTEKIYCSKCKFLNTVRGIIPIKYVCTSPSNIIRIQRPDTWYEEGTSYLNFTNPPTIINQNNDCKLFEGR